MNKSKPFSEDLYNQYDDLGRKKAIEVFKRYGLTLEPNADKYGIDLIAYKDGELYGYVEVEVRDAWKGEHFRFDTLNIPYRKRKLFLNHHKNCLIAFNSDCTYAFIADDMTILFSDIEESKNKFVSEGEHFYKVLVNQIRKIKC